MDRMWLAGLPFSQEAYADGCRIHWRQEIIDCLVQEKNLSFQRQLSPHHKRWSLSGVSASRRYPASYLLSRNGCALPHKLPEPSWETNMLMNFWKCDLAASWELLMLVLWYHTLRHFTRKFNRRQMANATGPHTTEKTKEKTKKAIHQGWEVLEQAEKWLLPPALLVAS